MHAQQHQQLPHPRQVKLACGGSERNIAGGGGGDARGRRTQRVAVLRCLVASLVVTVLLAGLAVLVFWLVVRPKPIDYAVTRAVVRHFNVTPPPGATVNATFYLTLAARNPNRRVSILYEWVEFRVLCGESAQLAVQDAPAFRQPRRNETRLDVRAVARSAPVGEKAARGSCGTTSRRRARCASTSGCARAPSSRSPASGPGATAWRHSARPWSSACRRRRRGRSRACRATSPSREGGRRHA
ncbi:hypothetical protein C2845_PM01G20670 [Panicum miliaceum]|uniref:Uncharacterized protein n=1 Tax=Panicum miliaceum TaxID=4540 RepID=A0A3L6TLD3_PANMI|nr:hypothetical protein C2845_PM01G20670 [Panicum miliaceum]